MRIKCAAREHNTMTPVRPEPGLLNTETQTVLTTESPRFPSKENVYSVTCFVQLLTFFSGLNSRLPAAYNAVKVT